MGWTEFLGNLVSLPRVLRRDVRLYTPSAFTRVQQMPQATEQFSTVIRPEDGLGRRETVVPAPPTARPVSFGPTRVVVPGLTWNWWRSETTWEGGSSTDTANQCNRWLWTTPQQTQDQALNYAYQWLGQSQPQAGGDPLSLLVGGISFRRQC